MSTSCSSATSAIPRRSTRRPAGRLLPGRPRTPPDPASPRPHRAPSERDARHRLAGRHRRLQSRRVDPPFRPPRGAISIRSAFTIRLAIRRSRRNRTGSRPTTLKRLPASIVSGPAAAGAANAFEAIARLRADLLFDHRPRLQPRVRARRARVAAAGGRVGAVPSAERSDRRPASCSTASRRSRRSSGSCSAPSRARRAFRSRAST